MHSDTTIENALPLTDEPEGCGVLDVLIGILLGNLDATCYFTGFDPESGWADFTSPSYQSWSRHQSKHFRRAEDLLDIPDGLVSDKEFFGSVPPYSRKIDDALSLVPDETAVVLARTQKRKTCNVGNHQGEAATLPLAIIKAFLCSLKDPQYAKLPSVNPIE